MRQLEGATFGATGPFKNVIGLSYSHAQQKKIKLKCTFRTTILKDLNTHRF